MIDLKEMDVRMKEFCKNYKIKAVPDIPMVCAMAWCLGAKISFTAEDSDETAESEQNPPETKPAEVDYDRQQKDKT